MGLDQLTAVAQEWMGRGLMVHVFGVHNCQVFACYMCDILSSAIEMLMCVRHFHSHTRVTPFHVWPAMQ